ncbi:MAG: hypothetical protein ACI9OJ_001633 [Myxococcota bacterium]|jgi:hypothetical protein
MLRSAKEAMKYVGHLLTLIGAGLVVFGVLGDWLLIDPIAESIKGIELNPGKAAIAVAGFAALLTILSIVVQRRSLVVSNSLTAAFVLGLLAWGFFGAGTLFDLKESWSVKPAQGFWFSLGGAFLMMIGALRTFAVGPVMSTRSRPLRVAMLWEGQIIQEQIFDEPRAVTVGTDIHATFTVPEEANLPKKKFTLFAARGSKYNLGLNRGMEGTLQLGGERMNIDKAISEKTSGKSGANSLALGTDDWGIIHLGPLAIFFQFIQPERRIAVPFFRSLDGNVLAAAAVSGLVHISLILATLFLWEEDEVVKRRALVFKDWDVEMEYDEEEDEEEEEEEDEGEEEDTTAKRAEGDEGKFGDPDLDPMLESKVVEMDGKMVSKIDPKKVGLVDMLSTNQLGGVGAIANIMSKNTQGLSDKMAVAMAGAGTEFVMGHGSGGMGFKGTGTGGGGVGGYGRIHGLGKIDTGGGTGMHASLGKKRATRVGRIKIGSGRKTGFCKKGDIARVVRRRANSIRACYERRLQVKAGLQGKLTVRWTIGMNGSVTGASSASNTLGDSAVTSCILRVVRRMRFTKPEGGVCIVQWPFVFNPGG